MAQNNLRQLRMARKLTYKQIGTLFQISPTTYFQWEKGNREPDFNMQIKLADFYKVSLDYLLGRDFHIDKEISILDLDNDIYLNKERIIPLINKISNFDPLSFNLLEGYIDGIIAKSKVNKK